MFILNKKLRAAIVITVVASFLYVAVTLTQHSDPVEQENRNSRSTTDQFPPSTGIEPVDTDQYCTSGSSSFGCIEDSAGRLLALTHRGSDSHSAWLWDAGGPGLSLPLSGDEWAEAIPAPLKDRNVVMVVEPWLQNGVPADCLIDRPVGSCDQKAITSSPERTVAIVEQAERKLGWKIESLFATSFGATRAVPLAKPLDIQRVVLETPAPPSGYSAHAIVSLRASAIIASLEGLCRDLSCATAVKDRLPSFLRTGYRRIATGQQVTMGILAATTSQKQNGNFLSGFIDRLARNQINESDAQKLKILGRKFWPESESALGPRVAMWADLCPNFTGWAALSKADDPLIEALLRVYRGCLSRSSQSPASLEPTQLADVRALLVVGDNDLVVPISAQRLWARVLSPKMTTTLVGSGHGAQPRTTNAEMLRWMKEHDS